MSDANRIGDVCWYKLPNLRKSRGEGKANWRVGKLRAWSTDFEESEDSIALYPVAVIEDNLTQMCHSVYVNSVCFADEIPME